MGTPGGSRGTSDRLGGHDGRRTAQLRLRVTAAAESILRSGHPWLFADSVRNQNRPGQVGELAVVYDRNDQFLALGLFDPDSPIRLRVLHRGKPRLVDRSFWLERLQAAVIKRKGLFDAQTTGFRWIHGESDGWPGLVLDRYDRTVVLKLYTPCWLPWLEQVAGIIGSSLNPQRIVLRLSRNQQQCAAERFGRADGEILAGAPLEGPVTFLESGLRFEADVLRGQKTGFFLDQRENRGKVGEMARGRSILNAFSFSGGFSLYAARGGARFVTDLDISPHALAASARNFELNHSNRSIRACEHETIRTDAFEWMAANRERKFDLVVLDPPSLARRESEREGAIRAYSRLASLGMAKLAPGGILLACSCSAHVSDSEFYDTVRSAALKVRPRFTEIERRGQPPDHPASFEEARYLKAIYLRF